MKNLITLSLLSLVLSACGGSGGGSSGAVSGTNPTNPIPPGGISYENSTFSQLDANYNSECEVQNNQAFRSYFFRDGQNLRMERDYYASGSDCNVEINYTTIQTFEFLYALNPDNFTDQEMLVIKVVKDELRIFNNQIAIFYGEQNYYNWSDWSDFVIRDITGRYKFGTSDQGLISGTEFQWLLEYDRVNNHIRLDSINHF